MTEVIPGPRTLPFIGNLLDLRNDEGSLRALEQLAEIYGSIYQVQISGKRRIVCSSAELMAELTDEKNFVKIPPGAITNRPGPSGLFASENDTPDWGQAHRILVPAFGPLPIENMFDEMKDIANQLVLKWARKDPEKPILVTDDFTRLTLDTIALCSMDFRFNSFYQDTMHPFVDAMLNVLSESGSRAGRPAIVTKFLYRTNAKFEESRQTIGDTSANIIKQRRENPSDKKDLLMEEWFSSMQERIATDMSGAPESGVRGRRGLESQEEAFAGRSGGGGKGKERDRDGDGDERMVAGVELTVPEEEEADKEKEKEKRVDDFKLEYVGPCRRCGLCRAPGGWFPSLGLLEPHPEDEERCVPGFWGGAAEGPIFGSKEYWALAHIKNRTPRMEALDKETESMIAAEDRRVASCLRMKASLEQQKLALEKAGGEENGDAVMGGAAGEVEVPKDLWRAADRKTAEEEDAARREKGIAEEQEEWEERRKRRRGTGPPTGPKGGRRGFGGFAPPFRPRGGGGAFGGMRPPSGPKGAPSGPKAGRGWVASGPGVSGLLGLGGREVDLEKVKKEVAEAREQVEKEVHDQEGRDLAAYVAKRPRHVSESDWLANKGEWKPSDGLKRELVVLGEREQSLQVSEYAAGLRKQAAEKEKKEREAREAALKLRDMEVQHFLRVREWEAGDWTASELAARKAKEDANEAYKEKVKGVSFHLFSAGALMAFDHEAERRGGGRIGEEARKGWTSGAFKSVLNEGLPSVLYTEEEMRPARPVMPAAVREARVGRGVLGEEEDAAIMGDYDSKLAPARKNWGLALGHLPGAMDED